MEHCAQLSGSPGAVAGNGYCTTSWSFQSSVRTHLVSSDLYPAPLAPLPAYCPHQGLVLHLFCPGRVLLLPDVHLSDGRGHPGRLLPAPAQGEEAGARPKAAGGGPAARQGAHRHWTAALVTQFCFLFQASRPSPWTPATTTGRRPSRARRGRHMRVEFSSFI